MTNKVNFRKIFDNLDKDALHEFINTDVREEYVYNCENLQMNGWTNRVMLTSEGKYYLTNPMPNNNLSIDEYSGNSIMLFDIPCFIEYDYKLTIEDIREYLTKNQEKNLYDIVCDDLKLDEEEKIEYNDIETLIDDYIYHATVEEKFRSLYEEAYSEILRDYFNFDFTYSILDNYYSRINDVLDRLEE